MFREWLEKKSGIENQISKVAGRIKHCGDYGKCFWNPMKKVVHWVAGDADGEFPLTDLKDIEKMFGEIKGVEKVIIADEYFPKDEEPGWIKIK